jgi:predicted nucleic acid-binding protein
MLAYFDSSILLAILLDEEKKEEAYKYWKESKIRVSSLLLKIETINVLRRTYEHYKTKLDPDWLTLKTKELDEYLNEVNFRIIDEEIERIIYLKKDLSKCRTLDAIHIATALEFKKIDSSKEYILYSFDQNMNKLAKINKIQTNTL